MSAKVTIVIEKRMIYFGLLCKEELKVDIW